VSLTAAEVAEIMRLVEQSSFDELTLEMNGVKLSLRRGGAAGSAGTERSVAAGANGGADAERGVAAGGASGSAGERRAAMGVAATAGLAAKPHSPPDPNIHDVPSPMLGTFYRSPKPGAAPFVEVGSSVEEDTVVAIIEVMKLMNTVRAGIRGTVTEILPADGSLVEYEQTLLRIRKPG
jgi:acetyl-CoA carboxylase biotin carboxyl carrier protein